MNWKYIIALITAPNQETGEIIANILLDKKLVACVNFVTPVISFFSWEREIDREDEVLLIFKSRADLFESDLIPAVEALHPYKVPEIMAIPIIMGPEKYLN